MSIVPIRATTSASIAPWAMCGRTLEVDEVWGADAEAVRQRRAVGDDVVAELALGVLDRDVDLADGRAESLDHPDEVALHVLGGRHRALVRAG